MNFPVSLTLLRLLFVPLVVVLLLVPFANGDLWVLGAFLLASLTDLLDGYEARRRKQVTALGILLDPLADKLLICSVLIALVALDRVPAWMVIVIVGRELAVSGLRAVASAEGFALQAGSLGKVKMVLEVIAISLLLVAPRIPAFKQWGVMTMLAVVAFAVISGAEYFWNFWRTLKVRAHAGEAPAIEVLPGGKEERERKDVAAHWR